MMIPYILNLIDMAITLHVLNNGATELNPIANSLITTHPLLFVVYKAVVVGALCCLLEYLKRQSVIAKIGLLACTFVYALVDIWHLVNLASAWINMPQRW